MLPKRNRLSTLNALGNLYPDVERTNNATGIAHPNFGRHSSLRGFGRNAYPDRYAMGIPGAAA